MSSVAALATRIQSIGGELRAYLGSATRQQSLGSRAPAYRATGIGCSEAPARVLASALVARGAVARYVPLSALLDDETRGRVRGSSNGAPTPDRLVVFSQGLSPNARLAFSDRARVRDTLLVTALDPEADDEEGAFVRALVTDGLQLWRIPPRRESGSLVRVVGPAVALLAAFDLAARITGDFDLVKQLDQVPDAVERAYEAAVTRFATLPLEAIGQSDLALVTVGSSGEGVHGLRWKLLEGLGHTDPAVWDVLQVAHGPLQHFYHRQLVLLGLADAADPLLARLGQLCCPDRHRLLPLPSTLPPPLDLFEHDAQLNALLLGVLEASPRDLSAWPAQGLDGPLYDLGR